MTDENTNSYFNPRYKAQSTSELLSAEPITVKSISATSSTSSLTTSNSPKNNLSSFLKMSLTNRKTTVSRPTEDRFVMTIIKSPSSNSQRMPSNSSNDSYITTSSTTATANDDTSNNSKFLKSKVTAALNHMKYRKLRNFCSVHYHQ